MSADIFAAADYLSDEQHWIDLAAAIADGTPVDWAEVASTAGAAEALVSRLRQIERLVRGHDALRTISAGSHSVADTLLTAAGRQWPPGSEAKVKWGPLLVHDKIGRGSFGDVYRAWDPHLEREVALKLMSAPPLVDGDSLAVEEGRLLARVRHPNVVTVYGAERVDGRVGIWMEYVRGKTLAEEVRERGPLSAEEAAAVGVEVCRALAAVHAAGLLHRDVKAHNVMRDSTGRIVLGDFGTGVALDGAVVLAPQLAGTPIYLAPEVLRHEPATVASDLYGVGVLLYFLVTGNYPVRGRDVDEIRQAHASGARIPLRLAAPTLPGEFAQIVEGLLDSGPDRRYATAASAEKALDRWLRSQHRPDDARPGVSSRVARRWMLAGGLVAASAVLAVAWRGVTSDRTESARQSMHAAPMTRQIVKPPCSGRPSRDGTLMACVESLSHALDRGVKPPLPLVIFNPDGGEMRIVRQPQGHERIVDAVLAPAGDVVVFSLLSPSQPLAIHAIDLTTGAEREVATLPADLRAFVLDKWSPFDELIECRLWRADGSQALVLLSPETGARETIFEFLVPPQGFGRSPDGRLLAFDIPQSTDGPERDIRVCELATSTCATAAGHPAYDWNPVWTPDGRLLFSSNRGGTNGLWTVALSGLQSVRPPELVRDSGRARLEPLAFTDDGSLFYTLGLGAFDVYSATLDDRTTVVTPVRVSPRAVDTNRSPVWSPDGRWLAYISQQGPFAERGSVRVVVQSAVDGGETPHRSDLRPNMSRLAWSPDGKRIAVRGLRQGVPPEGVFGIHLLTLADGRFTKTLERRHPPERFIEDQITDLGWTDDHTIVFASQGGIGAFNVISGDERRMWDAPGGTQVLGMALSTDASSLAVLLRNVEAGGRTLVTIPATGGAARELLTVKAEDEVWIQTWTIDGSAILVTRPDATPGADGRPRLSRVSAVDGTITPLPLTTAGLSELRLHPDGRQVLFTAGQPTGELWKTTALVFP